MAGTVRYWPFGLQPLVQNEAARLLLLGAVAGLVGGTAAAVFDFAGVQIARLLLGTGEPSIAAPAAWRAFVGPTAGGLLAGLAIKFGTRGGTPQNIPEVVEAARLKGGSISLRTGLWSALGAALVVGGGQSGGREGPIIQLAASATSRLCRSLGIPPGRARVLVAAGAAAGIAASFDTPLGAAFFALEIILGDFAMNLFGPVVAASVVGTVVGQVALGDRIAFHLPPFGVHHPVELLFYPALGALCGAMAVVFKRAITGGQTLMSRAPIPAWLRPVVPGVCVGAVAALGLNEIMSNGYPWVQFLLAPEEGARPEVWFLVVVLVTKAVATVLTQAGRGGSGIFGPSLFIGSVTGVVFGSAVHGAWPTLTEDPGAYGLVGMGAFAAAVMHAPISMALMLFELTRNYEVVLALLPALAVAGIVSHALESESIFIQTLASRGVDLRRGREDLVMYELRVQDVMRTAGVETLTPDDPFERLAIRFLHSRVPEVYVADDQGAFHGVVLLQDVKELLVWPRPGLTVRDVASRTIPVVHPDTPLAEAMPLFFQADVEQLAVTAPDGRFLGVLAERDVVAAYHREVLRKDALLARIQSGEGSERRTDFLELPAGHVMDAVEISGSLAGHTLRELNLPQRYGVTVIALSVTDPATGKVRRLAAEPNRILHTGDQIVVMGPRERVADLSDVKPDQEPTVVLPGQKSHK